MGAVGGESCSIKNGGPSNVNVELLSLSGDLVSSVSTSSSGSYLFTNIIPGRGVFLVVYFGWKVISFQFFYYVGSLSLMEINIITTYI